MLDTPQPRWTREQAIALFALPFNDLLFQAQTVHRQNFDPNAISWTEFLKNDRAVTKHIVPEMQKFTFIVRIMH